MHHRKLTNKDWKTIVDRIKKTKRVKKENSVTSNLSLFMLYFFRSPVESKKN
jgi:hypothetical protein